MVSSHPAFLWALPLAPLLAYFAWQSRSRSGVAVAVVHCATLAAVILTMAGPVLRWKEDHLTRVEMIEVSPLVTDATIAAAARSFTIDDTTRVIAFANRSERLSDLRDLTDSSRLASLRARLANKLWPDDPDQGGPNLSAALQLAAAQVPAGCRGEISVLASGSVTHGDAAIEAYRLAERGIPVRARPLTVSPNALSPLRVRRIAITGQARAGQTVTASVEIDSTVAGSATLNVAAGDQSPVTSKVIVGLGRQVFSTDLPLVNPGLHPIRASISREGEPISVGDTFAAVNVLPPANVLWVQDQATQSNLVAVQAMLGDGIRLQPTSPNAIASSAASADAIVLADTPADLLSTDAVAAMQSAVSAGAGLLLTGASRSFGPGGYGDSPLAAMLPVKMPQQAENIDPSVTLVLIVDTSGSMMGERMDLAKEIARLAMTHLKPHDKVGIVEFYGGKRWAAPIQTAANVTIIQRALDRLTPGGGTTLYPAVEEAAFALRNVRTRAKHLLVISDGAVEEAKFAALIRQMAEDGIQISAVQVGPAESAELGNVMPDLARWGNGRYYTVPDAYAIPDISLKQPQLSMLSPFVRASTDVVAGDDDLARNFVGNSSSGTDAFHGYLRTEAKPTADVILKTGSGDPLLTRWRYGSGFVATLPTQLGSAMTAAADKQFPDVLRSVMRQLVDGHGQPLAVTATLRLVGIEVEVRGTAEAAASNLPVTMSLSDANGQPVRQCVAEPISAGRWNVLFPNVPSGAYLAMAELENSKQSGTTGVAVSNPIARVNREADLDQLKALEQFDELAEQHNAALPAGRAIYFDLAPWLGLASIFLLLTHVMMRRWPLLNR